MTATSQEPAATYRPVSRKYLRYLLEGLNDEDRGSGTFAQLAEKLLHRRKCANIVPATEPSSGGDLGQDARTGQVLLDSDGRFRLYASPPTTPERWIFAFSVTKEWKPKLMSDAAKIVANQLEPDAIIFVTNQFIRPEHVKIQAERTVAEAHGVRCEILDGQWMLDELYDHDYALAVEFLGCEPERDPQLLEMFQRVYGLREEGLSADDALEYERLKTRVQYRNRYADTPEHLVQDLARLGALLTPYEARVEEAIAWYEEALPELDRLTRLTVGIELLNGYFKALQKLPGWPERIMAWLPKLVDMTMASGARGMYHHVADWLMFLAPKLQDSADFRALYSDTLARFRAFDRGGMGELSTLYLDETIAYLELIEILRTDAFSGWMTGVATLLDRAAKVRAFPIGRLANALGTLGPLMADTLEYETCFERAMDLKGKQEGGFSKAATLRDRALAHAKAQQLEDAIVMASRAKQLWFSEKTFRGYLLVSYVLAKWYCELGQWQAAEFELLEAGYLATWQPAYMEADIFAGVVAGLATIALEQGRVLRAYRWMRYYLPICNQYRVEPHQEILDAFLEHNLPLLAMRLYASHRQIHDRLVVLADAIDPDLLRGHKEIAVASDEEFEVWLADLSAEQQEECRALRQRIRRGEAEPLENLTICEELADEQQLEWTMAHPAPQGLRVRLDYRREPRLAQVAFTLAVVMQVWAAFIHRELKLLTFADDELHIALDWMDHDGSEPLEVSASAYGACTSVSVRITSAFVADLAGTTTAGMISLFLKVVGQILYMSTLDDPEEVMGLLDPDVHGEAIKRLSSVAHPAYLWATAFAQLGLAEDTDDDAA